MALTVKLLGSYKLPRGQWEFGEDGHTFTALTPGLLIETVRAYRRANRLPEANLEAQVVGALVSAHPEIGTAVGGTPEAAGEAGAPTLDGCIHDWVKAQARTVPRFAPGVDVMQRGRICAACPHNVPVAGEGLPRDLLLLTRGASLKDDGLGGCACFGHHNKLAVLLENYEGRSAARAAPAACWAKSHA